MSTKAQITYSEFGQSIWYDNIQKSSLENGEFARIVASGVRGCTSNPSIFNAAIAGSSDYDAALRRLVSEGRDVEDIYYHLAIDDIRAAADALFDVYEESRFHDGYVSIEVLPKNAHDTPGTVEEAVHIHKSLGRRNVMIKVPATEAGLPAITELIGLGIPVNVTLIFSQARYDEVALAYVAGLEKAREAGHDLSSIASVASFFVSRIDGAIDKQLQGKGKGAEALAGKAAIANAKLAYVAFEECFGNERFQALEKHGAQKQRVLWASTSTKNPRYPDTLYVDELIGPDTVNTVPPATLVAFQDHGTPQATLASNVSEAEGVLRDLGSHGVDLDGVCESLLEAGLDSFASAMDDLFDVIGARRQALLEAARERQSFALGSASSDVIQAMDQARDTKLARGIWAQPPGAETFGLGKEVSGQLEQRLGWLQAPHEYAAELDALRRFAVEAYAAGFKKALLLGMGGSSLCPEVLSSTFGHTPGFLDVRVLDSTDPASVAAAQDWATLSETMFIVASKSGSTIEVACFAAHFWQLAKKRFGDEAGSRFVAITDPDSPLAEKAQKEGYRRVFTNNPKIGGRYSALSLFGLVPAALMGVDVARLLDDGQRMAESCKGCVPPEENPGVRLGAFMAGLARGGRDKLTVIASPEVASLGAWIEQLVAESTGKAGKGVIPVVGEPLGDPKQYGADRAFVYVRHGGRKSRELDDTVSGLIAAGHPVATLGLPDLTDLGGEFFRWEMATAVAGALLGINPFDEPNVSEAKRETGELIKQYEAKQRFDVKEESADDLEAALGKALEAAQNAREGDYVVFSAFFRQTPSRDALFERARGAVLRRYRRASTLGYGPRFLHSTGQLHKGGPNRCVVIALTADADADVSIPNRKYSFHVLRKAQALGDLKVLRDGHQRRVVQLNLGADVDGGLEKLVSTFEGQ